MLPNQSALRKENFEWDWTHPNRNFSYLHSAERKSFLSLLLSISHSFWENDRKCNRKWSCFVICTSVFVFLYLNFEHYHKGFLKSTWAAPTGRDNVWMHVFVRFLSRKEKTMSHMSRLCQRERACDLIVQPWQEQFLLNFSSLWSSPSSSVSRNSSHYTEVGHQEQLQVHINIAVCVCVFVTVHLLHLQDQFRFIWSINKENSSLLFCFCSNFISKSNFERRNILRWFSSCSSLCRVSD